MDTVLRNLSGFSFDENISAVEVSEHLTDLGDTFENFSAEWEENVTRVYDGEGLPMWAVHVEICYLAVIGGLAIPGNTLILIVEFNNKDKASMDYLVLTMAVFDFLCATFNVFVQISAKTIWSLVASTVTCKLFVFTGYIVSISTVLLLGAVAVDRFIKTCKPFCTSYNTTAAKYICYIASLLSVLLSLPSALTYTLTNNLSCEPMSVYEPTMRAWNVFYACLVLVFFVVIAFSYTKIILKLKERYKMRLQQNQLNRQPPTTSTSKTLKQVVYPRKARKVQPINENSSGIQQDISDSKSHSSPKKTSNKLSAFGSSTSGSDSTPKQPYHQLQLVIKSISDQVPNEFGPGSSRKDALPTPNGNNVMTSNLGPPKQQKTRSRATEGGWFGKENVINRTNLIMFIITAIYVLTFGLSSLMLLTNYSVFGKIMQAWSRTFKMINCATNPALYFSMSSKFRSKAKRTIWRRRK